MKIQKIKIGKNEIFLIKNALKRVGSQNQLARFLGYTGRNTGCQINYFLSGRHRYMPEDKFEKLKELTFTSTKRYASKP